MAESSKGHVVVTGGSGLIGSAVTENLAVDHEVLVLDAVVPDSLPDNASFVQADLTSDDSVKEAFKRVGKDAGRGGLAAVVHLAAFYDFGGGDDPMYEKVTINGTRRVLAEVQDIDTELFIFSSTMLVHAPTEPGKPISETWPLDPKWAYPNSKMATEVIIRNERQDIPACLLRLAGVYTDYCDSIPISNQIQRIYEKKVLSRFFPGDLTHGQAFVHLDDAVRSIRAAVERRTGIHGVEEFLIGEEAAISYGEMQNRLGLLIHGQEWKTVEVPKPLAKTGAWLQDNIPHDEEPFIKPFMVDIADDHYELNVDKARKILGWTPVRRLDETLPAMVTALKADPLKWYKHHNLTPPEDMAAGG